jgi:hypothetical protein
MTSDQRAEIDALILAGCIIPAMARIKTACGVSLPSARDLRARYRQLRAERGAEFACGDAEYWSCFGEDIFEAMAKDW